MFVCSRQLRCVSGALEKNIKKTPKTMPNCVVELSVLYSVARSVDSQATLRPFVLQAAAATDRTLSELTVWPATYGGRQTSRHGTDHEQRFASPTLLRSPGLLAAVLAKHRAALIESGGGSGNFWEEMEFYTEIVDGLVGWLYGGMKRLRRYDDVAGKPGTGHCRSSAL